MKMSTTSGSREVLMGDVHIMVPIGDRDVNELRLFLSIFGAFDMTNDDEFIIVHTSVDDVVFTAADMVSSPSVIDSHIVV
jgi:hypothetical protein